MASAIWPSPPSSPSGLSYGVTSLGTWQVLAVPTPSAPNADPPSPVLLNEVSADNDEEFENPDAPGKYDDWVEILNPGAAEVDLAGMSLTDDPSDPRRFVFPPGSVVPAGGFLLVHADDRPLGGTHAPFRLPSENGSLHLYAADGTLVDAFAWDQMGEDRSRGRIEDGAAEWVAFRKLTPGAPNAGGVRDMTDDPAHRKRDPDYIGSSIRTKSGRSGSRSGRTISRRWSGIGIASSRRDPRIRSSAMWSAPFASRATSGTTWESASRGDPRRPIPGGTASRSTP